MKKLNVIFLIVSIFVAQFFAMQCSADSITAKQLKHEMDAKPDLYVINVLNKNSHKDCSIPGSVNIPLDGLKKRAKKWKKDKKIVVYCASFECPLSGYAHNMLQNLGFMNVRKFEGGLREWKQKGYSTNGPCKAGYLQNK